MSDVTKNLIEAIAAKLSEQGIDLENLKCEPGGVGAVKVVCIGANMRDSLEALGASNRDQVIMVRVDSDTLAKLDAWVETGAVRSRSEAAAVFIKEGLSVRRQELEGLEDELRGVKDAKSELRKKAREVLGDLD